MTHSPAWPAAHRYAPDERHPFHEHDTDQLSIVVAGSVAEEVGRDSEVGDALDVVFKAAGLRHRNRFGRAGARLLQLRFAPGALVQRMEPGRPLLPWRWFRCPAVTRAFLRVALNGIDDTGLADLLAAMTPARGPEPPRGRPPAWLARALEQIRDAPARATAGRLADEAGVHPVHLARCVRRWRGHSLGTEIRFSRLARAAEAVYRTADSISPIAHAHGFSDHAHLCRAFRGVMGVTPSAYRERLAALEFRHPDVAIVQARRPQPA